MKSPCSYCLRGFVRVIHTGIFLLAAHSLVHAGGALVSLSLSTTAENYGAAGQTVTFTYLFANIENVTVYIDSLVDNINTNIVCPSQSLNANTSETCTGNYTTTQIDVDSGQINNRAVVTVYDNANNHDTAYSNVVSIPALQNPALSVIKTSNISIFSMSDPNIGYFYKITNVGNDTLNGLTIIDNKLPSGGILCNQTTLAPTVETTCVGNYTVTQADLNAGYVTNIATASGKNQQGTLATSNQASVTIRANEIFANGFDTAGSQ